MTGGHLIKKGNLNTETRHRENNLKTQGENKPCDPSDGICKTGNARDSQLTPEARISGFSLRAFRVKRE